MDLVDLEDVNRPRTHRIVFFNGAPRSGKDTAGNFAHEAFPKSQLYKMSAPLKRAIPAIFGFNDDTMRLLEEHKDSKTDLFKADDSIQRMSYRDVQIALSEEFLKPKFGPMVFGRIAMWHIANTKHNLDYTFITDTGFRAECIPLVTYFGPSHCLLVRVYRDSTDFSKDSRSFVSLRDIGVKQVSVMNDGTLEEFREAVVNCIADWEFEFDV